MISIIIGRQKVATVVLNDVVQARLIARSYLVDSPMRAGQRVDVEFRVGRFCVDRLVMVVPDRPHHLNPSRAPSAA